MNQEKMGKFIAQLREEFGLTQKEVGNQLGVTDNSVSKWERGINAPDISTLTDLAAIFHVTVQELLNGERSFQKKIVSKNRPKVLEVSHLSKSFEKRKILDDVSFTIYEGDIIGLIGPNGAGKTTLIKTILGLYKINVGNVSICGYDTKKALEDALSKCGSIIENPDMYQNISGRKNLQVTALINNIQDKDYINRMVSFVKLEDRIDDKVKKYSLGMKQRLGLANALMKKPRLLILDEPTNGLDPQGMKELREILKKINREENISILISSHILAEVENICDSIIIMDEGKIKSIFGIEEVKYKNMHLEDVYLRQVEKGGIHEDYSFDKK